MLSAGQETTLSLITNAVRALLTHPDQQELAVRGDAKTWASAMEETLRRDARSATSPPAIRWRTSRSPGCRSRRARRSWPRSAQWAVTRDSTGRMPTGSTSPGGRAGTWRSATARTSASAHLWRAGGCAGPACGVRAVPGAVAGRRSGRSRRGAVPVLEQFLGAAGAARELNRSAVRRTWGSAGPHVRGCSSIGRSRATGGAGDGRKEPVPSRHPVRHRVRRKGCTAEGPGTHGPGSPQRLSARCCRSARALPGGAGSRPPRCRGWPGRAGPPTRGR